MGCVVRWVIAAVVVSLLMVAGAVGLVLVIRSGERPAEPTKASPPPAQPRPARKQPEPKPAEPEPAPTPPTKKERPSFEADWKAASESAERRYADVDGAAEKAMRLLTKDERYDASVVLRQTMKNPAAMYQENAEILTRFGFGDVADTLSAKVAMTDADFRGAMQAVWAPAFGREGIERTAGQWCRIDPSARRLAVFAILNRVPTGDLSERARDTLLSLGLRDWLAR